MKPTVPFVFAMLCASPTLADITVKFDEGAPKDRFTISQSGNCNAQATAVTIDLAGSSHGLIFDVTANGAGVEVFQPFEVVSGRKKLSKLPTVLDGDKSVTLEINDMDKATNVAFTIDVDDTKGGREITVSGSEIAGASVRVKTASGMTSGKFNSNAIATIPVSGCSS